MASARTGSPVAHGYESHQSVRRRFSSANQVQTGYRVTASSDGAVSSCVLGVYKTISFPAPETGKVMVSYPIDFQNDE